jgi:hypothetical protein
MGPNWHPTFHERSLQIYLLSHTAPTYKIIQLMLINCIGQNTVMGIIIIIIITFIYFKRYN